MKLNKKILLTFISGSILFLSGCQESTRHANQNFQNGSSVANTYIQKSEPTILDNALEIDGNQFSAAKTSLTPDFVDFTQNQYPEFFNKEAMIHLSPTLNMYQVVLYLNKLTHINYSIETDAFGKASGSGDSGSGSGGDPQQQASESLGDIAYEDGSLADLLNAVSSRFGIHWRWDGKSVVFYRYETRMFRVNALEGLITTNSSLNTQSSSLSTGGSGASSQATSNSKGTSGDNTTITSKEDVWNEVKTSIESVASKNAKINTAEGAGMVVVRDTPENLNIIQQVIHQFNTIYSKPIVLKVLVYSISRKEGATNSVNWDTIWSAATSKYGLSYVTGSTGSSTTNTGSNTVTISKGGSGPFAGSNAIFTALSSLGKTTLLTSSQLETLNGKAAPINVVTEQAYVQSYATTLAGTSGSPTTTITPGVVMGGFTMNLTPKILSNNDVLIRYNVNISSIDQITNYTSPDGDSGVQLPTITVRNFLQDTKIHSGDTVVMTGFQESQSSDTSSGLGNAKLWLLGGSRTNSVDVQEIVIVLTPYILSN